MRQRRVTSRALTYAVYSRQADLYDRIYLDRAKYQREIDFVLRHTGIDPEGARVLDVGCGTGTHASLLTERGSSVVGVDINAGMLRVARAKRPDAEWIRGDMRSVTLRLEFDLVLCMYGAINYIDREDDLRRTMGNLLRHARPGGFVTIETRWTRTIPDQATIDDFDGLLVLRRWSKGLGLGGSDIYALGILDQENGLYSLDLHNLYFQDPFMLADFLREAGALDVGIYAGRDLPHRFAPDTDEHEALIVGRRPEGRALG